MSKTLAETLSTLKDFSLNHNHGKLVSSLVEKIEKFVAVYPELLSGNVYADSGYDPEMGNSWNDLVVEDENGYSSIIVEFDEDSPVYANSGYDPELQTDWDEIALEVDGESITLVDFNN